MDRCFLRRFKSRRACTQTYLLLIIIIVTFSHSLNPFENDTAPLTIATAEAFGNRSTTGIVEATPDTFHVNALNLSFSPLYHNRNSIYKVQYNSSDCNGLPRVDLLLEIPDASLLNGLTKFNDTLLLAADSFLGVVFAINTETLNATVQINDTLTATIPTTTSISEGINGLHFKDGTLYFTNTQKRLFAKIELDEDARPKGNATPIATPLNEQGVVIVYDDFARGPDGNAYAADQSGNTIQKVTLPGGNVSIASGGLNSTAVAEPASAAFGRTERDSDVLYVVTVGGELYPVVEGNGTSYEGGAQVVGVKMECLITV
jgi:hypothetical protein